MSRVKPHTKVHISVAHHKKTQDVWADPFQRGMLVEVWRLAMERYAAKTKDILSLRPLDRLAITAASSQSEADRSLELLFRSLKYRVRKYPNRWDVHIRNYAKKMGIDDKELSADDKENGTPKKEERRKKKQEKDSGRKGSGVSKQSKPEPSANRKAREAWPAIRAAFASHGKNLSESIGGDRIGLISKRMAEGATEADLVAAVHGYVRGHGGLEERDDFNPRLYFQPATVFTAEGFSDRVDNGRGPPPAAKSATKSPTRCTCTIEHTPAEYAASQCRMCTLPLRPRPNLRTAS